MNTISQISAFLENRPGMLREILGILSEEGVNLRALNVAENEDYGILRIIPDNTEKTMKILKANEYLVSEIQVCAIEVPDKPGGLESLLEKLADDNVDIQYMYSVFAFGDGKAYMVISAKDVVALSKSVEKNNISTADKDTLGIN
ncbi:MAG: ACT domain-containing protein [Lachnospiraceae bacterium]|nr:ACT domain-containing protein [Lachnospiraceae bacterium]